MQRATFPYQLKGQYGASGVLSARMMSLSGEVLSSVFGRFEWAEQSGRSMRSLRAYDANSLYHPPHSPDWLMCALRLSLRQAAF